MHNLFKNRFNPFTRAKIFQKGAFLHQTICIYEFLLTSPINSVSQRLRGNADNNLTELESPQEGHKECDSKPQGYEGVLQK